MINTLINRIRIAHCAVLVFVSFCINGYADDGAPDEINGEAFTPDHVRVKPGNARIFYFTNRKNRANQNDEPSFGGDRGPTQYGVCEAEFSPIPVFDSVAQGLPFYLKRETSEITIIPQLQRDLFWEQLDTAVRKTSSGSVVLFIHGYNYGFERTCRMAAELQRSLESIATVVAFSWPSNGLPSDYVSDLSDVEWSVPLLSDSIRQLNQRLGYRKVQLLAHSLGSRGAIFSLLRLKVERSESPFIARLTLIAPDFDSQSFIDMLPIIRPVVDHITLYASSNDTMLKLSRQLSGYPRLGEGGEHLTVVEGAETIDVSLSGRYQITGHEYFFFNPQVVEDLALLLGKGIRASQRPSLVPRERNGSTFWEIRNQKSGE